VYPSAVQTDRRAIPVMLPKQTDRETAAFVCCLNAGGCSVCLTAGQQRAGPTQHAGPPAARVSDTLLPSDPAGHGHRSDRSDRRRLASGHVAQSAPLRMAGRHRCQRCANYRHRWWCVATWQP